MSEMNEKDLEQVAGGSMAEEVVAAAHEHIIKRDCGSCSALRKSSCQSSLKTLIRERVMKNTDLPSQCPWKH